MPEPPEPRSSGESGPPVDRDVARGRAIVAEAVKKTPMSWVAAAPGARAYAAWHVWSGDAVLVVSGGLEQPMPVLDEVADGGTVVVTTRSKETGGRLVTWVAEVLTVAPDADGWAEAAAELHAKRLNSPDGEAAPRRWSRESRITRLVPTGVLLESPGHMPRRSGRAEPPGSPATTRGRVPFTIGRRPTRRP